MIEPELLVGTDDQWLSQLNRLDGPFAGRMARPGIIEHTLIAEDLDETA